jgi:nucleoside-diphosphate-sugar epimerase
MPELSNTVLIVGASGLVGEAALEHFARTRDWSAIALSRRIPEPVANGNFRHVCVDLTDPSACREACSTLQAVTHVVYAALAEKPGLVAGWSDPQQMQINLGMLKNLLEPLCDSAPNLTHVTLLQGTKAYGAHVGHQMPLPARERAARVTHANFYWLQEDYLRAKAQAHGFAWTILRPQVVIGAAWGAAMNPLLALAAYAALRREEGQPFSYPGGTLQITELVDAALLAEAFQWAAESPSAHGEIFNITNGDVFAWREAWPVLASAFGMSLGADEPLCLADYLTARVARWERIVEREHLRPIGLARLLGESHHYADLLLRGNARPNGRANLLSTIKLRQAGFAACRDSEQSVVHWIGEMQRRRLIPPSNTPVNAR